MVLGCCRCTTELSAEMANIMVGGEKLGEKKNQFLIAKRMLSKGFALADILEITALTKEELIGAGLMEQD